MIQHIEKLNHQDLMCKLIIPALGRDIHVIYFNLNQSELLKIRHHRLVSRLLFSFCNYITLFLILNSATFTDGIIKQNAKPHFS